MVKKRERGRPANPGEVKPRSFRLSERLAEKLLNLSEETGIPQVKLVEWAIEALCQVHKKRPQVSIRVLIDEFSTGKRAAS